MSDKKKKSDLWNFFYCFSSNVAEKPMWGFVDQRI